MKTKTKTIRRIVSEHDPAEYERAFNDMAEKLSRFTPEIKDVFEDGRFTSIFSYEVTEKIPENAKDRAKTRGHPLPLQELSSHGERWRQAEEETPV